MKTTIISIIIMLLSGCAFVSKEIHPDLTYREYPFVEITAHGSWWSLQSACFAQHKVPHIYIGCALVPVDPNQNCIINVMRGNEASLQHELLHCKGHKDTPFFWRSQ